MKKDQILKILLLLFIGVSFHFGFRHLSAMLPQKFPHIEREATRSIPIPTQTPWETDLQPIEALAELSEPPLPPAAPIKETPKITDLAREETKAKNKKMIRKMISSTILRPLPVSVDRYRDNSPFIVTPALAPLVEFWARIYGMYTSANVVIHDMEDLSIVYKVLDFTALNERDISDAGRKAIREAEVAKAMNEIKSSLDPVMANRLRSQTGMKNRFEEGLKRSGRYIPLFEQILIAHELPTEISRLPFVESLFHEQAFSKVKAAGLWQFMADSARKYMTVNSLVDERYDPLIACHGAAKLLSHNYNLLGTWPLAINAYNSGPGNLMKAMNALGTKDIAKIITQYRGGSYAFASRNFYPSFLAALHVYENRKKYFGNVVMEPLMAFDLIELPTTMSFPEIAYLAKVSLNELKSLNPAFDPNIMRGTYSLPPGSQVRIPVGTQTLFAANFIEFKSSLDSPELHIVEPGETYQTIASQYETTSQDLENFNASGALLKEGHVIRVPPTNSLVRIETR